MEKLKLYSSVIVNTSNTFCAAFQALNGVFNIRRGQTDSMNSSYKGFDSYLATCKLTSFYATIFLCLYKHADDIKDSGKHMSTKRLIETSDPKHFSHFGTELENGTILVESNNMYLNTIAKS